MSTTKVKPEVAWPKCDDAGENPDWGFVGVDAATQCMSVRACCLVLTVNAVLSASLCDYLTRVYVHDSGT